MPKDNELSHEQETAIEIGTDLKTRIFSVTGGAGTGKTTVLGRMYHEIKKQIDKSQIVLAAPTGRAAKRIQELTGIPAKTIHRLLEFPQPFEGEEDRNEPRRNNSNRLFERVVIIDEASMLGPTLYGQLMDALPNNGSIRFFGDNNQLPPVERGVPPFVDLLRDKASITLTFNFRSEDAIVGNAIRILHGSIPVRNSRFEILYSPDPIKQLYTLVEREGDLFAHGNAQIIMPTRRGNFGTLRVNPTLQQWYNPDGPLLRLERFDETSHKPLAPVTIRAGDKFIWTKNDYDLNLYNGDIGSIDSLDPDGGSLVVGTTEGTTNVPPRIRSFSPIHGHYFRDPRKAIELGYAITTHKSQGSEFNTVVYCVARGQGIVLNRNNFYTGVTRARERVVVISDSVAMRYCVGKARDFGR